MRTSTHSLNSGNLSPTDASTGLAHSSNRAHSTRRARKCGLDRILPTRIGIMLSSFTGEACQSEKGKREKEERKCTQDEEGQVGRLLYLVGKHSCQAS